MRWLTKIFKRKSRIPVVSMGDLICINLSGQNVVYVRLSQVEMDVNGPVTAVFTQRYPEDIYYV